MQTHLLKTSAIDTPSGSLELLVCLPQSRTNKQPILCIHGAHCAAACYKKLLPIFAQAGYPSYALSLRGHGKSWQPSTFDLHVFTTSNTYVADVMSAIDLISSEHPDQSPILIGHSLGGGVLQRALGAWNPSWKAPAGLVLIAPAPLSGGAMDIARKWQAAEAKLKASQPALALTPPSGSSPQGWIPWFRSLFDFELPSGLETPAGIRSKFFLPETPEEAVTGWLRDSKGRLESMSVTIGSFWPFADASAVFNAIDSDARPRGRKVFLISANGDVLITEDVIRETYEAYHAVCQGEEEIAQLELKSGHHIMLDVAHQQCASSIIRWIEEEKIDSEEVL
ncbi:alpha/beta-hydrolase [Sporormia fimetaria CBS 119925]|uniref:Alpha/beta-hydrolase n=1 Tax=Sporormia fimetaria CBS 119925 TaxID=1340428 RepID=A0A6A6UW41_9PLEO|nr:alpha/beta-hydrolase [Sporormia fimetaria CBS 119925]